MKPIEVTRVDTKEVSCDGGSGASGHPRIFLNMGDNTEIECPYCGRQFKLLIGATPVGE